MLNITLINQTTLIDPVKFYRAVAAMQIQVTYHVAPYIGEMATLSVAHHDGPGIKAPLYVVDTYANAPQGALGWHSVDNNNRPYGIVPVKTNIDAGYDPIPTISHELVEMIGDLYVSWASDALWGGKQAFVAMELCDPVEDQMYDITLADGEKFSMSNFVLWPWFEATPTTGAKYDFLGKLAAPLTLTAGGYASYYQNNSWQQATGHATKEHRAHPHPMARLSRRIRKHEAIKALEV